MSCGFYYFYRKDLIDRWEGVDYVRYESIMIKSESVNISCSVVERGNDSRNLFNRLHFVSILGICITLGPLSAPFISLNSIHRTLL